MSKIKICDAPMGAGKTSAAINYMNQHWEKNFLFITPYLKEVDRICEACAERQFITPVNHGEGKLENLEEHLAYRRCIASTHALFSQYNDQTAQLIKDNHYTLILDEVANILDIIKITKEDIHVLFGALATYDKETGQVIWLDDAYKGKFEDIMQLAKSNRLIYFNEAFLIWEFPIDVFTSFDEVIILTYMHECQIQTYYLKSFNIDMQVIYVDNSTGEYLFSETPVEYSFLKDYVKGIHVCDHAKLNAIGERRESLSKSWYLKAKKSVDIKQLKDNCYNFFRNICNAKAADVIWTTFKDFEKSVGPKGYRKGFVACNIRATNEFRGCTVAAYCVNIYTNPIISQYFYSKGIEVDQDRYALSTLVQWIWRLAIRDGKEVYVYIPSSRMRKLFLDWINEIKN